MATLNQDFDFQAYTILIVDDNPANLGVLFNYLDSYGFELMVAQDGESGLEKAEYNQPDIILLDALMPGLDGFDVCRRLKDSVLTRDIPVIFMTALTGPEDIIKGFAVGAVDYVTKPIRQEELLARVATHLRLRDLTRQLQQEIIERGQAEAALAKYRDHLEELVEQRTVELRRAVEQLEQEIMERRQAEKEVRQKSEQLRALTTRLAEIEETERRRLARELHDRVGQELGTLNINLNIMRTQLPKDEAGLLQSRLDDSLGLLRQVAAHVYDVMGDLRSPVLDDYGLVAALNGYGSQFSTRTGIKVMVRGGEETTRWPPSTEDALFRIAQEALTNVARHAQATQTVVSVETTGDRLHLVIADDGIGFDPAQVNVVAAGQGWGLISMTERAEAIGGLCRIESSPQRGTQVIVEVSR